MFGTGFLWGLGISCGVVCGLVLWFLARTGLESLFGKCEGSLQIHRDSLAALVRRNAIASEMAGYLKVLADAAKSVDE